MILIYSNYKKGIISVWKNIQIVMICLQVREIFQSWTQIRSFKNMKRSQSVATDAMDQLWDSKFGSKIRIKRLLEFLGKLTQILQFYFKLNSSK